MLAPATRWVLFSDGKPLLATPPAGAGALARLSTQDVRALLGPAPFFAQGRQPGEDAEDGVKELAAARLHGPPAVFLGVHEHAGGHALPAPEFSARGDAADVVARIRGTPYFGLDVSDVEAGKVREVLDGAQQAGVTLEFVEGRAAMGVFGQFDSGVFSVARTLVDWSARNKVRAASCVVVVSEGADAMQFCAGCGSPVYTLWAGWKHGCTSLLPWAEKTDKKPCPTAYAHITCQPIFAFDSFPQESTEQLHAPADGPRRDHPHRQPGQ